MGKGDIKTRRGKLFSGSYGNTRPRKKVNKPLTSQQLKNDNKISSTAKKIKADNEEIPVEEKNVVGDKLETSQLNDKPEDKEEEAKTD